MKQGLVLIPGVWTEITEVGSRFLSRARAIDFQFSGDEEAGLICPACQDHRLPSPRFICDAEMAPDNGQVLNSSHKICVDCLLQLRGAPIAHDGQL